MSKTTAAKRQNGRTGIASMKDLFLPNMRVMMPTTTKMMRSAPTAMPSAEMKESPSFHASKSVTPIVGSISLTISAAAFVGVPAAPKGTGVEFRMRQEIAAAIGGKPKPMSSGAAIAAGVPKPAAPSMKALNAKPTMTSWMRASSVMPLNMPWMRCMAPALSSMFISRIAPKMMRSVSIEPRKPATEYAAISKTFISQAK